MKKTNAEVTAAEEAVEQEFLAKQVGKEAGTREEEPAKIPYAVSSTETLMLTEEQILRYVHGLPIDDEETKNGS
jgi:hypothetical protein